MVLLSFVACAFGVILEYIAESNVMKHFPDVFLGFCSFSSYI